MTMKNRRIFNKLAWVSFFLLLFVGAYSLLADDTNAEAGRIWHDAEKDHEPYIHPAFNNQISKLVKSTLPAVVSIATKERVRGFGGHERRGVPFDDFFDFFFNQPYGRQFERQGLGTGFIINEEGYILTNNHVIENADEITVELEEGESYPAEVIGRDDRTDLGLLKINAGKGLPFLKLGDSEALDIGHIVIAMGNPLGLSHTVTQGIVSQKGRNDIAPSGRKIYANFIQTDASINPGNSGGPLVNIYGEVVGINTAIARGNGIGFAIPVNMAKKLLPQLATGHVKRSYIGIQVQAVTDELAESLGLDRAKGALVASVVNDSPAEKAGLKPEDVILSFDGHPIDSHYDLTWRASTAGVGKTVALKIWRDRKIVTKSVTLGLMPGDEVAQHSSKSGASGKNEVSVWGIHVINPTKAQLKEVGITDGKGALVKGIEHDSGAFGTLMRGDVIRKVNNVNIKNADHFERILKKLKKGRTIRLFVNRNRHALFIAFRLR